MIGFGSGPFRFTDDDDVSLKKTRIQVASCQGEECNTRGQYLVTFYLSCESDFWKTFSVFIKTVVLLVTFTRGKK